MNHRSTTADFESTVRAALGRRDLAAARQAVEAVLAREPRNVLALLLKGDVLLAEGDAAAAAAFYEAAIVAVPEGAVVPHALRRELERAETERARLVAQLAQDFRRSIGPPSSPRFAQALDILLGERQFYPSQPRHFHFPELPTIQFHDRSAFPWLDAIEAATDDIRAEMLAVLDAGDLVPYVQSDPRRPAQRGGLVDNPQWSAFFLWQHGQVVARNAERCPRTMAALAHAPLTQMPGRSPAALFSVLRPGTRIPPHHGFVNTRLIVHLPLVVPQGCALRVGNEVREWVEGRAWLFDDTIEHEAWNPTDRTRVILLFEVWRPELSAAERAQVSAMFEAVDRQRGAPGEWSI
ncbi:aspartyl/asparaginyl beta-hydroxylase domain-containing protein [Aquincola sp. S2]|uniref:Aspartyl/asparaginyl beta-hydroxylase domain-containing protein n=1 Tax=Pseudaquabacterium terrae TaxID=2732868 RepID=A0ABX2EN62_9BURK|nr:aspartyl/asparaginyl beta-hydroxylase domain-containing protein [Aquabacterium terrae]NRF70070.1 aspartyl/asparaginyl beta-hydroxylase domain-containing protein [Aquabacterium terrae]